MMNLPRYRAEAAHLPHQPLEHRYLPPQIGGPKLAGLYTEIHQDRTGFEDADRRTSRAFGVDDRWDLAVRADSYEGGGELFALADVHRLHGVGQSHFFQRDADLAAVRGVPGVQFDRHKYSPSLRARNVGVRITAIAPRFKTRTTKKTVLRSNAIEIGHVLLNLPKPRHAFERSAVPPGYGSRALHVAGVSDPGIVCVALKHEGLCRTSDAQSTDQGDEKPLPRLCRLDRRRPVERSKAHLSFVARNWTLG